MAMDSSWATSSKSSSRRVELRPLLLTNSTLTISPHQRTRPDPAAPTGLGDGGAGEGLKGRGVGPGADEKVGRVASASSRSSCP